MRLLIVGPQFFSYTAAISKEINKRGIRCFTYNELHSNSVFAKLAYRLNLSFLFKKKVLAHRKALYSFIDDNKISDILFISPDIISSDFLRQINKRAKSHLYMWDGFRNKKRARSVLDYFCTRASFDMFDCQRYGMAYVPLFAESEFRSGVTLMKYDMSFCGTVHSDRPSWIKGLLSYSEKHGLSVGLLLYYYSPLLLLIRLGMNRYFGIIGRVSFQPFAKTRIADLFRESRLVVDLTHPNQSGLTSRTFEALRTGSKLATNNRNCKSLEKQFPGRIFVFDKKDFSKIDLLAFLRLDVQPLTSEQDRFLSVERFADQILENICD